jgi:hypothetical protein
VWRSQRQAGVEDGHAETAPGIRSVGFELDCPYGKSEHTTRWATQLSTSCMLARGMQGEGHIGYTRPRGSANAATW